MRPKTKSTYKTDTQPKPEPTNEKPIPATIPRIIEASPTPVVLSIDYVIGLSNYMIKQNASLLLGKWAGVLVVTC
jgi:hypothetical protein